MTILIEDLEVIVRDLVEKTRQNTHDINRLNTGYNTRISDIERTLIEVRKSCNRMEETLDHIGPVIGDLRAWLNMGGRIGLDKR